MKDERHRIPTRTTKHSCHSRNGITGEGGSSFTPGTNSDNNNRVTPRTNSAINIATSRLQAGVNVSPITDIFSPSCTVLVRHPNNNRQITTADVGEQDQSMRDHISLLNEPKVAAKTDSNEDYLRHVGPIEQPRQGDPASVRLRAEETFLANQATLAANRAVGVVVRGSVATAMGGVAAVAVVNGGDTTKSNDDQEIVSVCVCACVRV